MEASFIHSLCTYKTEDYGNLKAAMCLTCTNSNYHQPTIPFTNIIDIP